MEIALRAALARWLAADATLAAQLNAVTEEAPSRTSLPWLAIASSSSTDWSCKTNAGREIKVALELQCRGDTPDAAAALVTAIEASVASLPRAQTAFQIVSAIFLRASVAQHAESRRAITLEYRFRVLAN